jgi:hypothetical protein
VSRVAEFLNEHRKRFLCGAARAMPGGDAQGFRGGGQVFQSDALRDEPRGAGRDEREELPDPTDLLNLRFAREALGRSKVRSATVVCRARNGFPLDDGCRAVPEAFQFPNCRRRFSSSFRIPGASFSSTKGRRYWST